MLQKCVNHHFGCFASFLSRKVSEMLQDTLNDFGSIGVEWMLLLQNDLCNFGAKNSAFRPETQVLHHSIFLRFLKCSKTLQIIIWVEWSRMDVLVTKPYLQLRYPK
jgi:hypothetical protein